MVSLIGVIISFGYFDNLNDLKFSIFNNADDSIISNSPTIAVRQSLKFFGIGESGGVRDRLKLG